MQRLMEKQTKGCSVLARWRTRVRKRSGWPSMTLACRLIRNQQEKVRPPGGGNGLGAPDPVPPEMECSVLVPMTVDKVGVNRQP